MALRRTLSLRSLFSASYYKPSCSSIIHREEKLNYDSFLRQRSFTSSMFLSQQHLMRSSSSHLPLCTPFGVSIYHRSMSTSRFPGSNVNKISSVLQDVVASQITTVTKVVDAAQMLIDKIYRFVTKALAKLARVCLDIKDQGGDVTAVATSQKYFYNLVTDYGGEDIINCSTSAFSLARTFAQPWLYPWVGITEKVVSFTKGGALYPHSDLTSPYALSLFPVLRVFQRLIGLEWFGILSIVGLTTLGKRNPKARIVGRFLAIPVVLLGMVLSKAAQFYFKTCTMFSLGSMYLLIWCHLLRQHYLLNANASNAVPTGSSLCLK